MVSIEIRKLISRARKGGISVADMENAYNIPRRTIYDLLRHEKVTGSMKPQTGNNGRPPAVSRQGLKQMRKIIEDQPDITLSEIKEKMHLTISISAICRIVHKKLGFRFKKKTLHASERDSKKNKAKRKAYLQEQKQMEVNHLVFIDESGVHTGMTRRYGRAKRKNRAYDQAPINHGKTTTIISSVRLDGSTVPMIISGSMNGEIFKRYSTEYLAPQLQKGDIVLMDNLSSHKVEGIKTTIEKTGATVVYIPPYSPDLNPIEEMWSKLKAYMRKVKIRTTENLLTAITDGFKTITAQNCSGWFWHAGYAIACDS